MKKFLYSFFSMEVTVFLFIVFAISSAVATIVESVQGTPAAWAYIYGTDWFGAIMVLLGISLVVNMVRYNMEKISKLPSFIFHLSFLFILIGAILTRYFGFEGSLHIREGNSNNVVSSREIFVQLIGEDDGKMVSNDAKADYIADGTKNAFEIELGIDDKDAILTYKDFIAHADLKWVEADGGEPIVELLFADHQNKRNLLFKNHNSIEIADLSVTFNEIPKQKNYISIYLKDDKFYIKTNQNVSYINTVENKSGVLQSDIESEFSEFNIYTIDGINFSATTLLKSGTLKPVSVPETNQGNNVIMANLSYNGESKDVFMFFGDRPRHFEIGGKNFLVAWGPKDYILPFSLHLKDFKMDRYPGSNSPSGYNSLVEVEDKGESFEYEIYMNHVLDHGGYRFFQSSYDMDELGTILTVNRDPGKFPTYLGYIMLSVGMFFNFFNKNSRFLKLSRMVDESSTRNNIKKDKK